jgi:hypothetical protein
LVYLVYLVGRTGNSSRRTRQTRKTSQPDRRTRARCASTEDPQSKPTFTPFTHIEEWPRLPFTARIERSSSIFHIDPSQLASFFSLGRVPMLVYMRPSNEALLRARVPGAQDQHGCPSHPSDRARSASKKGTWPLPLPSSARAIPSTISFSRAAWSILDCAHPTRAFCFLFAPSQLFAQGSRRTVFHCAHRTSTVSSCAFCEQERWFGGSLPLSHLRHLRKVMREGFHPA